MAPLCQACSDRIAFVYGIVQLGRERPGADPRAVGLGDPDHVRDVAGADPRASAGAARDAGRPVVLDYYADWCVDCLRMERGTFQDPVVNRTLREGFVLLQVDVTDPTDAEVRAIKQRFGLR